MSTTPVPVQGRTDLLMRTTTLEHYSLYTNQRESESVIECDRCSRRLRTVGIETDWETLADVIHLVYEHEADHHLEEHHLEFPILPQPRLTSIS